MTHATAFTPAEIGGLARRIDRPVVLVGLMGVGKSTVGRRLAALLDTDFIDVDEEIERAADRSVSEIFEAHGELYFRAGERRVIARLVEEGHGVIATGHHRADKAMRDVIGAFVSGDPFSRLIVEAYGADYLVMCTDLIEPSIYAGRGGEGALDVPQRDIDAARDAEVDADGRDP